MNLSKYLLEKQLGGLGTSFCENLSRIFVYPLNFGEAAVHTQVVTLDGRLATSHYSPPPKTALVPRRGDDEFLINDLPLNTFMSTRCDLLLYGQANERRVRNPLAS